MGIPLVAGMRQLGIPLVAGLLPGLLIVDLFCGGVGGASAGLEDGLGRSPDIACNHNADAVYWHELNHPATEHLRADVRELDPAAVVRGRRVGWLHVSPDCTYFSLAKGSAPIREQERRIRSLPWIVLRWAATVRPLVISLENVPEIEAWGPIRRGKPITARRGQTWRRYIAQLRSLGYVVEWRRIPGHDFGAGTRRERLYLIARCDGQPIVWPAATHGGRLRYRTTADYLDWSRPCPSIFLSREEATALRRATGRVVKRPLADDTLRRIAAGVLRQVVQAADPYVRHLTGPAGANSERIAPFLSKYYSGDRGHRADEPLGTITTWDHHALITCETAAVDAPEIGRAVEVASFIMGYYGSGQWARPDAPLPTITCTARHALVTCILNGRQRIITDIGMRMLEPDELAAAQGLRRVHLPPQKAKAIEFIGNSVVPQVMAALSRANAPRPKYRRAS